MRRRDFLLSATFLSAAPLLSAKWALAQGRNPTNRAAVVIGVDQAGRLQPLRAAASGALEIATWLRSEGFVVDAHIDTNGPVTTRLVKDSVKKFVKKGTIEQLVVYFSGHGFLVAFDEFWMLSGAPDDPDEAINLRASEDHARVSSIPNVVFISDACRSTTASIGIQQVTGSTIFPNSRNRPRRRSVIDSFFATLPGAYSLEVPVDLSVAQYKGIYTTAFLDAFRKPDQTTIVDVNGEKVVPNRRLKDYLLKAVPRLAQAENITLDQRPDSRVESDLPVYIGHARQIGPMSSSESPGSATPSATAPSAVAPAQPAAPPPTAAPATIRDVVNTELSNAGLRSFAPTDASPSASAVTALGDKIGFNAKRDRILNAQAPRQFETHMGFSVNGAMVQAAYATRSTSVEVLQNGNRDNQPAIVRLNGDQPASLILVFENGTGCVVAALPEYIGTIVADKEGVESVTYTPSENSPRWNDYQSSQDRLRKLRALVATAAQFGVFQISGDRNDRSRRSAELADSIRILKAVDPTLGLYAAYAYAYADILYQVRSVMEYMRGDLGADLFDVAVLAGKLSGTRPDERDRVVPFCPMLSQGWNLLQARNVKMLPELDEVRNHQLPSLWTTFDTQGMKTIVDAFNHGRFG